MNVFQLLKEFILSDMRMSQIYQPVMLIELLKGDGEASVRQIAQAILDRDPTQIEYFSEIVKNMVGRVLTKNRGITEKHGNKYRLKGASELTAEQIKELMVLCQIKINEFEQKRGDSDLLTDFQAS